VSAAYAAVLVVFVGTAGSAQGKGELGAEEIAGTVTGALAVACLLVVALALLYVHGARLWVRFVIWWTHTIS
jgi:hypothetical protein